MHVALDSNLFIADRWFEGSDMRALIDYLKKTPWTLVLSEVVETEVKARVRRDLRDVVQNTDHALRKASRHRVLGVPDFDLQAAVDLSYAAWESHWDRVMVQAGAERVHISVEAARDAATRAAERVPPCNDRGEGMRDALIWAGLLDSASPAAQYGSVAFVSSDGHFSGPDGRSLKEELSQDLHERGARVSYYPSLYDFVKERAVPVAHITKPWILERLPRADVAKTMEGWVHAKYEERALLAAGHTWDDLYVSDDVLGFEVAVLDVKVVDQDLEEFYVWQFDDGHLELRMQIRAQFDIDAVTLRERYRRSFIGLPRERWEVKYGYTVDVVDDRLVNLGMEPPVLFAISRPHNARA